MRIRITGEKPIIDDLRAEFGRHGIEVEPVEGAIDKAALSLGLLEAAAITTIVVNTAKLIEHLVVVARHLKDEKKRRLEVKSAAETALIEIDSKSTRESLEKQLAAHHIASGPASGTASTTPSPAVPNADKKA
jgi:hypothetical protein